MSWWSRRATDLAVETSPGMIRAIFSFFGNLFRGRKVKEAAKELGEDVLEAAEKPVEDFVQDGVTHALDKLQDEDQDPLYDE